MQIPRNKGSLENKPREKSLGDGPQKYRVAEKKLKMQRAISTKNGVQL
jgi:hypothetical protein